uniref:Galactose mutarotase n=1 Tax=Diabrotica virgifera virgifera TaxID=50390 RepID=A0A6P7HIC2_DIAVI
SVSYTKGNKISHLHKPLFFLLGKLLPVVDTVFDLRIPKVLGDVIHKIPGYDGYDHNFCINKASKQQSTFAARAFHPPSGRALEVYTNQPGVQFYCSNSIPDDPKKAKGKYRYSYIVTNCFDMV